MGWLLVLLSVYAFSDNLFTDVGQKSNKDPKYIIHGLFCFAWFIIFLIQVNYVRKLQYKQHIRLGLAGMLAAVGVFVTTLYIFIAIFKGWQLMTPEVKANRFFMPAFAVFVYLGYRYRKQPAAHKRYMFIATIYMLGPILARAMAHSFLDNLLVSDLAWDITLMSCWTSFILSLLIYDRIILKRIHPVTIAGTGYYALTWVLAWIT
jgi:hypothetical protein